MQTVYIFAVLCFMGIFTMSDGLAHVPYAEPNGVANEEMNIETTLKTVLRELANISGKGDSIQSTLNTMALEMSKDTSKILNAVVKMSIATANTLQTVLKQLTVISGKGDTIITTLKTQPSGEGENQRSTPCIP